MYMFCFNSLLSGNERNRRRDKTVAWFMLFKAHRKLPKNQGEERFESDFVNYIILSILTCPAKSIVQFFIHLRLHTWRPSITIRNILLKPYSLT